MLIAKDAALGVNWLHRSKPQFLHLDLKAANLLVCSLVAENKSKQVC
jgi:hypothetical protein